MLLVQTAFNVVLTPQIIFFIFFLQPRTRRKGKTVTRRKKNSSRTGAIKGGGSISAGGSKVKTLVFHENALFPFFVLISKDNLSVYFHVFIIRRKIQEALNQQTFTQFKSYAEQQFPGNPEQVPSHIFLFLLPF